MPWWLFSLKREMVKATHTKWGGCCASQYMAAHTKGWHQGSDLALELQVWATSSPSPTPSSQSDAWLSSRDELCGGEACVSLCPSSHCQISCWLLGFSVFGNVGSFWWWLPLAGDCCWNSHSPSTSATKTSFLCMFLPRLPVIKAKQWIRASA